MPPFWKIKREITRLGQSLPRLPRRIFLRLVFRRYYDLVLARQIKTYEGALDIGSEIGLYLIFPKSGVLASHLHMLSEMRRDQITPIVISNHPLESEARALLHPHVALILERPNQGYDFGGYRDGILHIADDLPQLDRLWILNDSAWLVPQTSSWFETARSLNVDYVAATSSYTTARLDPDRFRDMADTPWDFHFQRRYAHYASYALGLGSKILQHPDFLKYWRNLHISNDKTRTVRRGEIGLTRWMLDRGFSHQATCEVDQLPAELATLSDMEIARIAHQLIAPEGAEGPLLEKVKDQVLTTDPTSAEGRQDRINLILTAVSRFGSAYCLQGYFLEYRGFHFLKKSPLWTTPKSAGLLQMLLDQIEGPEGQAIRHEAAILLHPEAEAPPPFNAVSHAKPGET